MLRFNVRLCTNRRRFEMAKMNEADKHDFIYWLATHDPKEEYRYSSVRYCPIAQYLTDKGFEDVKVFPAKFSVNWGDFLVLPDKLNKVVETQPWTYGAAVKRAQELL
jgi:hypothetical protein